MKTEAEVAYEKLTNAILRILQDDPHLWSKRPCASCKAISDIVGHSFGCYEYQRKLYLKDSRLSGDLKG